MRHRAPADAATWSCASPLWPPAWRRRRAGDRPGPQQRAADFLSSDGSGHYLLVGLDIGETFGWIGHGRFHRLADANARHASAAW